MYICRRHTLPLIEKICLFLNLPYIGKKYYHLFEQNVLNIWKNPLYFIIFLVDIWNHENMTVVNDDSINIRRSSNLAIYNNLIFMRLTYDTIITFFISKIIYILI